MKFHLFRLASNNFLARRSADGRMPSLSGETGGHFLLARFQFAFLTNQTLRRRFARFDCAFHKALPIGEMFARKQNFAVRTL